MKRPTSPEVSIIGRVRTDSPRSRGWSRIRPAVSSSKPRATPNGALIRKWIHSTWRGVNGCPSAMLNSAGAEERQDERHQHQEHEADVLVQVVVELASLLDGVDDRREVVVGEDHPAGVLRHLGAAAHRDADVRRLDRRRVVDAVAGHRDDVALLLQRLGEQDLVLRRDPADDADRRRSGPSAPARRARRTRRRGSPPPGCPSCSAIAAPVKTSSPVTMRTRMCAGCASATACLDSSRGGSTMPTRLVISSSLTCASRSPAGSNAAGSRSRYAAAITRSPAPPIRVTCSLGALFQVVVPRDARAPRERGRRALDARPAPRP